MNIIQAVKNSLVVKRSSLANHKNPPTIPFISDKSELIADLARTKAPKYPNCSFFVSSDLHHYNAKLGMEGNDWEEEIGHDRKLFNHSKEILENLVENINKQKADYVFISGDLTKDGEILSHIEVSDILSKIDKKKEVFVIPGNHDLYNPDAASFHGKKESVKSADREMFAHIYTKFGYEKAFTRHKDSLSYTALLKNNLMLLALDTIWANETEDTDKSPKELLVDGRMQKPLWQWIEEQLIWARTFNKAVIVMQHHPFIEHWEGELDFMPEYLIENHSKLANLYSTYGARLVLVGHFHAQNLSIVADGSHNVYQILTSSPITYPCCYRYLTIKNNILTCKSDSIESIPSIPSKEEFKRLALDKLHGAVRRAIEKPLKLMGVSDADREKIIKSGSSAYQLNYEGQSNEEMESPANLMPLKESLGMMGQIALNSMGYVIEGMSKSNNAIDDNDFSIDLGN